MGDDEYTGDFNQNNHPQEVNRIIPEIIAIISSELGCDPRDFNSDTPLDQINLNRVQIRRVNKTMGNVFSVDMGACVEPRKPLDSAPGQYTLHSLRNLTPFSRTAENIYLNCREPISRMTIGSLAASIAAQHLIHSELITGYQPTAITKRGIIARSLLTLLGLPTGSVVASLFIGAVCNTGNEIYDEIQLFAGVFFIISLPIFSLAFIPGLWALWRRTPQEIQQWASPK